MQVLWLNIIITSELRFRSTALNTAFVIPDFCGSPPSVAYTLKIQGTIYTIHKKSIIEKNKLMNCWSLWTTTRKFIVSFLASIALRTELLHTFNKQLQIHLHCIYQQTLAGFKLAVPTSITSVWTSLGFSGSMQVMWPSLSIENRLSPFVIW